MTANNPEKSRWPEILLCLIIITSAVMSLVNMYGVRKQRIKIDSIKERVLMLERRSDAATNAAPALD